MSNSQQRFKMDFSAQIDRFSFWVKRKYPVLINALFVLLLADVVIDPKNLIFHVKYILFVLLLGLGLINMVSNREKLPGRLWFAVVFISLFMPLYALSVGILRGALHNTRVGDLVYFNSFFFFLIVLVTKDKNRFLTRSFNNISLLVVFITIGLYLTLLIDTSLFGDLYKYFVMEKGAAMYALRSYGKIIALMIYYKTSPLLVFPLSYYLYQLFIEKERRSPFSHYLLVILIAGTLVLSGTRANLFSLLFIFLFYVGFYIYRKSKIWSLVAVSFFVLVFLFMIPVLYQLFLNPQIASNSIKFGYIASYADYFQEHLLSLIFGQGIGGEFFAFSRHRFMNVTELTYLELIRIWGIPIASVFGIILAWPLVSEIRSRKLSHLFIAYLAYLFIAGTNPLLLSSTGMLVLVYVFSMKFGKKEGLKGSKGKMVGG